MKNIFPKIIVLFAAVILWFLIVSGQRYIGVVDMPLTVYEPREDVTLGETLPQTVKVRVEGSGRALYFQRWSKKSLLILDVGTINDNRRISLKSYFNERPNQVRLQPDMSFLEIVYPDSIDIFIDKKTEKTVPVHINADIKVRSGFIKVGDPDVQYVVLTGPENYLDKIDIIQSEKLSKDNVDMTFETEIGLINPNPDLILLSREAIKVSFQIEMIGERTIMNVPVQVKNRPEDLNIQFIPNSVSLRITGGNTQIQSLTASDFYVYFDYLSQWFPNKNFYPIKIMSPEEVLEVIKTNPDKIEVVVSRKNSKK